MQAAVKQYLKSIEQAIATGNATEHTFRPALKELIEGLAKDITAINEPKRIACGAPDFIVMKGEVPLGYIEAKDIGRHLDEVERSEQMSRYLGGLGNLILTDYLEFRWYAGGKYRSSDLKNNAGIEYMLVGGLAVGIWGEPRATVDIDFMVSFNIIDFAVLSQKINDSNAFVFIHDKPMTFDRISLLRATLKSNLDVFVDFLFANDDFQKGALSRRQTVNIADFTVNIPTPEDLILLKLISGREQDLLDAKKIFIIQKNHLDMEYVQRWSEKLQVKLPFTESSGS